jgi:trehalose utilization protein
MGTPGTQKWNEGTNREKVAISEDGEDIWQDIQEDHSAEDHKANSQVYDWAVEVEQEDIVEQ